ncbi:MAG: Re/Si-specific NAD(P)(+) transhydrogenase subunit alpha [Deltaproteobacteria bacterium]|nr:Re/Si-specific NAD(P)(+) transhydrogenase subunit alpha [Deltaproteobacteria bacterium]
MRIGVVRETRADERRVAATPETAKKLIGRGHEILVENGAGSACSIPDAEFAAAGARVVSSAEAWGAEMVLKVQKPTAEEAAALREGAVVVSFVYPGGDDELAAVLRAKKATVFAMEAVPRISRAQTMDALSSMANIAGYRAVIEASYIFPRYLPLLMTAAGRVPPAQVLVVGAGVAGLSAIATAKRLGAVVKAFDTRPAVKDQVKSVGGEFLQLDATQADAEDKGGYARAASEEMLGKIRALLHDAAVQSDIVITTALVGGRTAPRLIEAHTVEQMKPGSVVVDLAVEGGGNVACTRRGEAVEVNGTTVIGYTNLAGRMPFDASRLYARNILNLLVHMHGKEGFNIDLADEITGPVSIMHAGEGRVDAWKGAN